jgi:hypothetical protein
MDGCSVGEKTGLVEEDACRDWRRQTRLGGRVSSLKEDTVPDWTGGSPRCLVDATSLKAIPDRQGRWDWNSTAEGNSSSSDLSTWKDPDHTSHLPLLSVWGLRRGDIRLGALLTSSLAMNAGPRADRCPTPGRTYPINLSAFQHHLAMGDIESRYHSLSPLLNISIL